jgi:membrane protease YdiL (CAAX protease family)
MSADTHPHRRLHPLEAFAVVVLCFGLFIASSVATMLQGWSMTTRGRFDDASLLSIVTIEIVTGTLAIAFLWWRGHRVGELLPRPTPGGTLQGLVLLAATFSANLIVLNFLFDRHEAALQPIEQMASERSATLSVVLVVSAVNGLYEEAFLMGYLMRGLRTAGASIAIGVPLLVRLLYHLYQGPMGATSVLVYGAIVGVFYWRSGQLWPIVFVHIALDVTGLA